MIRAAAPAAWGAAIEVPLQLTKPLVRPPLEFTERTDVPGAKRSTHDPTFEKPARPSSELLAATVRLEEARAGETLQALVAALPAAATTTRPALSS